MYDYATVSNASNDAVPRGVAWAFCGLFKRGKTYGAARWNPSGSTQKTLYLDAERCVLRWEEYAGMTVLPITSFNPPKESDGKIIPPDKRGYIVNGETKKAWSLKEAMAIIKAMVKNGDLAKHFEIVVIDSVDALQKWSEESYLDELNKNKEKDEQVFSIGDVPHGAAWSDARYTLVNPLVELKELVTSVGVDIGFVIHSKTTTQVANKWQRDPALRAGVTNALFGEIDAIGYIDIEDSIKENGAVFGTVYEGHMHTISFNIYGEILTGGIRMNKLVNKTFPFAYKAIEEEYKKLSATKEK